MKFLTRGFVNSRWNTKKRSYRWQSTPCCSRERRVVYCYTVASVCRRLSVCLSV